MSVLMAEMWPGERCNTVKRAWRAGFWIALFATPVVAEPPASQPTTRPAALEFVLTYDERVCAGPFSGRVWVMTSQRPEPRLGPNWFNPEPFLSLEVTNWKRGEPLRIDARSQVRAFPRPLAEWPTLRGRVQAVMELNTTDGRRGPQAAGNGYSPAKKVEPDPRAGGPIELKISKVAAAQRLIEDERIILVEFESRLLSAFCGHKVLMRAAVCLPEDAAKSPEARYPTVYDIPGFGGDLRTILSYRIRPPTVDRPMVFVVLEPNAPLGHHAFVDSANNGPWGRALVEELIPHLEKNFPLVAEMHGRFLTGGSSGGWASLWLQIRNPEFFNGTWSYAPDPVSFHDFTGIDLYKPQANVYVDENGRPRPLAREEGRVAFTFEKFARMEAALGPGGQLASFEAAFGARLADGTPQPLYARENGALIASNLDHWSKFDICKVLEKDWANLGPRLSGKLHVYCGDADTFYLDGAVRRLADTLRALGSDAEVKLLPGRDHFSLYYTAEARGRYAAMAARFAATSRPATNRPTTQPAGS